jgi:hypothetical protein
VSHWLRAEDRAWTRWLVRTRGNVASTRKLITKRETAMKTPTVDDKKPKRDNLGPTGPAKISGEKGKSGPADGSYEDDLDHILDRKREKPSG